MTSSPIICIGQQPNGFFPKNFFVAKILTALHLQKQIGGKIVWFCHDSDNDYRETITHLTDRQTGKIARLNFTQNNKIQKKFSPLYAKRIPENWQIETSRKLPQYTSPEITKLFDSVKSDSSAGFCIRMYQKLNLLKNIEIVRSSDPQVRKHAIEIPDFFVDTVYEGEVVRARYKNTHLELHSGGDEFISISLPEFDKSKISPTRDTRFSWMQSVINCTHYILGEGERSYLNTENFPDVNFITRNSVHDPDMACTQIF